MTDSTHRHASCPDCDSPLTRRQFVRVSAAALAAPLVLPVSRAIGNQPGTSETLVGQLYGSFTSEQRAALCFPFDHELRQKVDNNWHIVPQTIGRFLNEDQQDLVKQIFMTMHSDQYAQTVYDQVKHDSNGDFGKSSVAVFGEPGTGKFQFVMTGRHCTRRCDGDAMDGRAFGGPIFYGHAAESFNEKPDHPGNAYWYQALRANEVFKALDARHRKMALRTDPRKEQGNKTVELTRKGAELPGVPCSELTADQKALVKATLKDLLAPFRPTDVEETMKILEANGGIDAMSMAFYQNMDVGDDGVWDVWQIQGPGMIWYFRGDPHVHTWVNIQKV